MESLKLPMGHRECLWSPVADLITEEGFRTLKPGESPFILKPEHLKPWPEFSKEVKDLLEPYCGKYQPFRPRVPDEVFGTANELGVQGRFVNNALHPVGEICNLLKLGVSFGDAQWGRNRLLIGAKKGEKRKQGAPAGDNLVPDLVVVETRTHAIKAVAEVKTFWAFAPKRDQSWHAFIVHKIGQLARYMDDHHTRYGIFTVYEYTWFVKRIDNLQFAMSQPISARAQSSATSVSLRECIFATVLRGLDDKDNFFPVRYGSKLVSYSILEIPITS
ncbi:uncharacterized protein BO80DRAFT_362685 [Aspergillus ibericus CBS 121593]|uniref:Fungal-type protein kinase domain-containing protein n=1 Tax=Aspergillus ibericus CBS 121593 TaxID=1448316 RepID=A0A395GQV9_9EURO|nr:hypothetical protein BO80DRAFT_362685 [Aspergillus ibericus CBS 121593]RAK97940.1 hypothetical protein BO80DRAFT_362685 [Aspergillus ibericus CBS 121593]